MRLRFDLINACVRYKCTNVKDDSRILRKVDWKRIHVKRIQNSESNREDLTSKNGNTTTSSVYSTPTIPNSFETRYYESSKSESTSSKSSNNKAFKKLPNKSNSDEILNKERSKTDKDTNSYVQLEWKDTEINADTPAIQLSHQRLLQNDVSPLKQSESNRNIDSNVNLKDDTVRVNEINMQMLPRSLHERLFKKDDKQKQFSEQKINIIKDILSAYGIDVEKATRLPNVNLKLPALEGCDIEEHFYNIGKMQVEPYLKIINAIMQDVPQLPKQWLLKEGWTRYTANGAESVDYPLEDGVIFDVEVCMKQGPLPTLATAVSDKAWYGWVSSALAQGDNRPFDTQLLTPNMFVPLESGRKENGQILSHHQKRPKIVVGHNVSYDRSRIKEQYWLNCTGTRFLDTMSLHVCVSGFNSYQRSLLMSKKVEMDEDKNVWKSNTSLNSLQEVHKLYCDYEISKEQRSIFVEGTIEDVKNNFDMLISYCASDVVATHNVLRKLFPLFQERFPHPVTLAGMLELGLAYLPVNSNWKKYLEESDSTFDDLNYEVKSILAKRADAVCQLRHDKKYKEDLWMWDEDWSIQEIKLKKKPSRMKAKPANVETTARQNTKEESSDKMNSSKGEERDKDSLTKELAYLEENKDLLPVRMPHMPGYPAWYRKLCPKQNEKDWGLGPQKISTSMRIAPKLLNLTWEKYPLHYMKGYGWGILVPYKDDPNIETKLPWKKLLTRCPLPMSSNQSFRNTIDNAMSTLSADVQNDLYKTEFWQSKKEKQKDELYKKVYNGTAVWCNVDIDDCCYFFKLPHKNGPNYNVGNPLAKDFLNKFSENELSGDASAFELMRITRMLSYWRNNRNRITSQLVVWLDEPGNTWYTERHAEHCGAIVPQVIVSGTLTRRAVESTWMTASNADIERVGSELRCMVQAPPGYNIVGADVDSQELWIASMIGDAHYTGRIHGATPFGWMTLIGTKSNGTDMHSVTAKAIGISRDHAKIINYARIYGAGQKFAERLLKQFNPSMTDDESIAKSRKMFALTKGTKVFKLKDKFINDDIEDKYYSHYQAYQIVKLYGKTLHDMFHKSEWMGGSESAMFNRLEEIAGSKHPVTPFLNSRLSRALETTGVDNDDKFLPTKINWVVQSGAVDFLHLMLVCMRWLMRDNARFCLSIHDEVRYLVPSNYKYNAALAMHVTNLLTRSFCASRLGMKDLPMSVAFFSAVEVDTVLRKETTNDCETPSNPHGLQNGYKVPPGESLDVWAALKKSGGSLGSWHDVRDHEVKSADSNAEKSA